MDRPVPITMGSPRFRTWEGRNCLVTRAWFPGEAVLEAHVHDRPTFAMILSGGFDLAFTSPAIRRPNFSCRPGSIFIEPAGERHANYVAPEGAQVIVLQPDVAAQTLPPQCLRVLDRIGHFRDGPIAAAGRRLAREVAAPDDLSALAAEGLVLEILAEAARLDEKKRLGTEKPPQWLIRATEFLHDHFREHVRMEQVAAVAGVHEAHLAAVFRRVHRVSLGAYMRRLRVDWAAERLAGTDAPISMIAGEAGFSDQAHLTRWFKRVTGSTPAAYRQVRRG